jgi:hypothetical protein
MGTVGMTDQTIKYLTASSVSSNPITTPTGYATVKVDYEDLDGYRIWTGIYAIGTGNVIVTTSLQYNGNLAIYSITALGAAPSAPAATLGGTVNQFEASQRRDRFHEGVVIYEYRWAEAKPGFQIDIESEGKPDGSIEYQVTQIAASATTPAYPGGGTGYLVRLKQTASEGHYVNRASWIKPPADDTLSKQVEFTMPGLAYMVGNQLILQPPARRTLIASVAVTYATSQNTTDTPFSITTPASFYDAYTIHSNGNVVNHSHGLAEYLAASSSSSGTNSNYNGVLCDAWEYALNASSPTALPTGATCIHKDNDKYLTDVTGTIVYRRIVTKYTF